VFLYCLMSNHVHLLVGTPRGNLGRFMGWWLTAYTVYFNRKYNRSGHLTQGRYGAKLVEGDDYLLKLSRYIHLNPVQIGALKKAPLEDRIAALHGYRWSSFQGYGWARRAKDFVRYDPLLDLVARGRKNKRLHYRQFVEKGLERGEEEWRELQGASRLAIGSEAFLAEVDQRYAHLVQRKPRREDIALRRTLAMRVEPEAVLEAVCREFAVTAEELMESRHGVWDRAVAARSLIQHCGLTQRVCAERLGVKTGAAISIQLTRLQEALKASPTLQNQLRAVDEQLTELADHLTFKG
jgi:hypothetical protein